MGATVFDLVHYKATTREQWQAAAPAWDAWGPVLREWLGPATGLMLDMAGIRQGDSVLDVAAGAGDQTLMIAERVGPAGHVLATDIAPAILAFAAENARRAGHTNIQTMMLDGEALEALPEAGFDAVVSRVGLIYFPDQQRALAGMRRALKPGGRMAAIVYGPADRNAFFSTPMAIIRRRAALPPPLPGQPGPFSLASPGVLEEALRKAGFHDIRLRRVDAPLRLPSAAECLRFEQESFGALHQMLAGLDEAGRAAAWAEIAAALRGFDGPKGFEGPCELIITSAAK